MTAVAGECENYENGDDYPDKALVVTEKLAKAVVIHNIPPRLERERYRVGVIASSVSYYVDILKDVSNFFDIYDSVFSVGLECRLDNGHNAAHLLVRYYLRSLTANCRYEIAVEIVYVSLRLLNEALKAVGLAAGSHRLCDACGGNYGCYVVSGVGRGLYNAPTDL